MNVHINDNKLLVVVEDDHSKHILHHLLDLFNKKKDENGLNQIIVYQLVHLVSEFHHHQL